MQLYLGDCLEIMRLIPDASVDMVLADLPYGTTRCPWDILIPFEPLWAEYRRIVKESAAIVLHAMQPFEALMIASNLKEYRYEWTWEKGNASGFLNAKKQPLRAHESVQVFYRSQPTYNPQMTGGHKRKITTRLKVSTPVYGATAQGSSYDSTDRYPRSVLFFSSDKQRGATHPTQKPLDFTEYLIRTYTNPGDVVMDNTMGSGTAGVACVNTGREFIGIEKDPDIWLTAFQRIEAAQRARIDTSVSNA